MGDWHTNVNDEELSNAYNRVTKEVLVDGPESGVGEFVIDWDDEEATKDLVVIPQISSDKVYELMVNFAKKQEGDASERLLAMLKEPKPFSQFKSELRTLELGDESYDYENAHAEDKMTSWLKENG